MSHAVRVVTVLTLESARKKARALARLIEKRLRKALYVWAAPVRKAYFCPPDVDNLIAILDHIRNAALAG